MSFLYWFDVSKFTNDTEYFFHMWIIHFPFLLCEALFSYPLPFVSCESCHIFLIDSYELSVNYSNLWTHFWPKMVWEKHLLISVQT